MSEDLGYITGQDAASKAATWLLKIEERYNEDLGTGDTPNFQIEAALAQGWATLAVALS